MDYSHTIAIIDNNIFTGDKNDRSTFYLKYIAPLLKDHRVNLFRSAGEFSQHIQLTNTVPEILMIDSYSQHSTTGGYKTLKKILETAQGEGWDKRPRHIIFTSADFEFSEDCKAMAEKHNLTDVQLHCTDTMEIMNTYNMLFKGFVLPLMSKDDTRSFGFNSLLNQIYNHQLPASQEAFDNYLVEKGLLDDELVVPFYKKGKISSSQALQILSEPTQFNYSDHSITQLPSNTRLYKHKTGFNRASGAPVRGYAAFTIEQARDLSARGKPPILIVDEFRSEWYPFLIDLAGIVSLKRFAPGHLTQLAQAHNVSILIDSTEKDIGGVDLTQPTADQVFKTTNCNIRYGDPITMETRHRGTFCGALHETHIRFEQSTAHHNAYDIPDIYNDFMKQRKSKPIDFQVTIDSSHQIQNATSITDKGIGLIRTENLVFAQTEQINLMQKLILLPCPPTKLLNRFYSAHATSLHGFFNRLADGLVKRKMRPDNNDRFSQHHVKNALQTFPQTYPITVRLLDISPEEMLTTEQLKQLDATDYGAWRGVQLAHQCPHLYQKHIKAVFRAYANMLNSMGQKPQWPEELKKRLNLNILLPNVNDTNDIHRISRIIGAVNPKSPHHVPYKLGSMIENLSAVTNVEDIAAAVDFISIGSNDLSAAVLGVTRAELTALGTNNERQAAITLDSKVKDVILDIARRARMANPDIEICLCGAHAQDLHSLKAVREAKLDAISVPPSMRNIVALYADWGLYDARESAKWPKIEPLKPVFRNISRPVSDLPPLPPPP